MNYVALLKEAGCENLKTEDRMGDTRSGWFQDGCFLAKNAKDAWNFLNG